MVDTPNDATHLTGVEVKKYTGTGIIFSGNNDDFILDAVNVHDNGTVAGLGIVLAAGSDDGIIRNSTIEDNSVEGIYLTDGSGNQILNNQSRITAALTAATASGPTARAS